MRSIELNELLDGILSLILIPYLYTVSMQILQRKVFLQERIFAGKFYQRALLGFRKKLGLDHPTTLACSKHHSSLLRKNSGHARDNGAEVIEIEEERTYQASKTQHFLNTC